MGKEEWWLTYVWITDTYMAQALSTFVGILCSISKLECTHRVRTHTILLSSVSPPSV